MFRKRAGIVLLHAGVALVMANELVVYGLHVENEMRIREGETVNYVYNTHATELAVVDHSNPKTDDVVVVPQAMLKAGQPIRDERLPFDVEVVDYFDNANLGPLKSGDANRATAGLGLEAKATKSAGSKGTDADAAVDMPAAYVKLVDKKTHQPIGTYLVSTMTEFMPRGAQSVDVGGKPYELALALQAHLHALLDAARRRPLRQIPGHADGQELFVRSAPGRPHPQRRPRREDLDEQPAALRRRNVLSASTISSIRPSSARAPSCRW